MSRRSLLCCCKKDDGGGGGGGTPCLECQQRPPDLLPCSVFGVVFINTWERDVDPFPGYRNPIPRACPPDSGGHIYKTVFVAPERPGYNCDFNGYAFATCTSQTGAYVSGTQGCLDVNRADIFGFFLGNQAGPLKPTGTYRTIYRGRNRLPAVVMNTDYGPWACDESFRVLGEDAIEECTVYVDGVPTGETIQYHSRIWVSTTAVCMSAEKRRECCNSPMPTLTFSLPDQGYFIDGMPDTDLGGILIPAHDVTVEACGTCIGWATDPEHSCCCNPQPCIDY